ncbi:putative transcription factor C2H2 family [Helianthus annuus]|nr:putative transcription factor C2H2 family [Helianthus annuus]
MTDSFDLDEALAMDDPGSNTMTVNAKDQNLLSPEEAREKVSGMRTVGHASGVCTVCMESLYSSCKQAPCGHLYHAACITQWLSFRNSCPVCRFKVPANSPVMEVDQKSMHFT